MRKRAIPSILVLILTVFLVGQAVAIPIGPSAAVGVKGGVNLSKMSDLTSLADVGDGADVSDGIKMGFIGGGFLKFAFGPLNTQIEGLYSVKGNEGTYLLGSNKWETKLSYFEVPFLLKVELPLPALAPYVYAGPSIAFLLKAEKLDEAVGTDWVDIKDGMKSTEWSLAIGGGVKVLKFHFDVRYLMGLTELEETDSASSVLRDSKNRTVSFMVGYDLLSF